jgi:flagella basal body P-ring formation protein FlgA
MQPKRLSEVFGKVALRDLVIGDPVQEEDVAKLD